MRPFHLLPFLAASGLAASPATAHPKLLVATPAAGATVAKPARVQMRFSEKLVPNFSGADLVMVGMPGMKDHPPVKVTSLAAVASDGRTLVLTPTRPLGAGTYRVDWHVVSADTHRITGTLAFAVK